MSVVQTRSISLLYGALRTADNKITGHQLPFVYTDLIWPSLFHGHSCAPRLLMLPDVLASGLHLMQRPAEVTSIVLPKKAAPRLLGRWLAPKLAKRDGLGYLLHDFHLSLLVDHSSHLRQSIAARFDFGMDWHLEHVAFDLGQDRKGILDRLASLTSGDFYPHHHTHSSRDLAGSVNDRNV